jgi:PEGA domain.
MTYKFHKTILITFLFPFALLAGNPPLFTPEEQQSIKSLFLEQTVLAKVDMPMTTIGFTLWWNNKKRAWVQPSFTDEIRTFGLGVKAGNLYKVTAVTFNESGVLVSLGDGGLVTESMQSSDKYETSVFRQAVRQAQYNRMQAVANGSTIGLYFHKYQFTSDASKVEVLKELVERAAVIQHKPSDVSPPAAVNTVVDINSDPATADIEIDGRFSGQTPSTVELKEGDHRIIITKQGYLAWQKTLSTKGGKLRIAPTLVPLQN